MGGRGVKTGSATPPSIGHRTRWRGGVGFEVRGAVAAPLMVWPRAPVPREGGDRPRVPGSGSGSRTLALRQGGGRPARGGWGVRARSRRGAAGAALREGRPPNATHGPAGVGWAAGSAFREGRPPTPPWASQLRQLSPSEDQIPQSKSPHTAKRPNSADRDSKSSGARSVMIEGGRKDINDRVNVQ